jgi:chromosomal replication initiator protein
MLKVILMQKKELLKEEIWEKILIDLSNIYSKEVFEENFLYMVKPYKIEKEVFFILVENEFIRKKIFSIYLDQIKEISKKYTREKIFFKFLLREEILKNDKKFFLSEKKIDYNLFNKENLEINYNFDNFIEGESNFFAFQMCKKIANSEVVNVNPLYIFGSVGLGKTHLLYSIGNFIFKKKPHKKILYIKADAFIEEFANQLKKENMEEFKNKYRNIDILLIDDIQMMSDAKRTQVEFFKIFDYLNLKKKQIVITSDKPISELNNIMERLTNRFQAGLIVDIKKPDRQHCLDILKKKILQFQAKKTKFKKEVLEFISSHFCDNIREMEGALLRILNYSQIYDLEISLQNTILSLGPLLKNKQDLSEEKKFLEKIKKKISEFYNINFYELINKKRHSKFILPRHIAIYVMKIFGNISFKKISFFLNRKYSSVFKAFKKIENKIKNDDKELKKVIDIILKKIN